MYLLEKDQYHKIHAIIKDLEEDCTFAYGVALNGMPGRIYVDDLNNPKSCLITCGGSYLVAGQQDQEDYNRLLIKFLKDKENHVKYYDLFMTSPQWKSVLAAALEGYSIPLPRTTYSYQKKEAPNFHKEIKLEEGYELKRMDEALFHQFVKEMYSFYLGTWGSVEKFLESGITYAVLHEGKIASICFASGNGGGYTEIGVITNDAYRKKGLALITCSAYIEECLERGITPTWNCGRGNVPSDNLAQKLGFTFVKHSDLIFWHENQKIIQSYLDGTNFIVGEIHNGNESK